jgi:hypothetical protein
MADRMTIPQTDVRMGGPIEPRPAWFKDEHGFVWLRCACGQLLNIDTHNGTHTIDAAGVVTPSLWHHTDGNPCGFHVFGTLQGWEG